jgi:integrase
VGELTALQVGDLSTDLHRIRIHRSGSWVNGHLHIDTPKTPAGERTIPVPGRLRPILERETEGRSIDAPLFGAPMGGYFSAGNFLKRSGFKAAAASAGVPALRIHDLRHIYASLARASGADLKTLQAIMGHSSITVTADLYSHLYDDDRWRRSSIRSSCRGLFVAF